MVDKVTTPVFRLSFPQLMEAKGYDGGEPKFSLSAVFDPSRFTAREKEQWAAMEALADKASQERFKKNLKDLPGNFKKPFRDGAEKADLAGYGEGTVFCNLSSKMRPGVIDKNRNNITDADEVYPGCYCRATITAYSYDNKGKGVAFGLQNVMKVADGERLDSRTDAQDDFDSDYDDDDRWGHDPLDD
jgi:hypothetical protein